MKQSAMGKGFLKQNNFSRFIIGKRSIIVGVISALLILLFTYASTSKLIDLRGFTGDMNNQPFPNWMTSFLVWGVLSFEILISVALMFDKSKIWGLWSSLILMLLFTIYTAAVLLHVFDRVPCSCGGVIKKLTWNQHMVFNLFFVVISAVGILLHKWKGSINQKTEKEHNLSYSA